MLNTNFNSVIGFYCPEKWKDTTHKKDSLGDEGWKDIKKGKPFLFYFLDEQIQIIKLREDVRPFMASNEDYLM